jgi:hypothetical protein
VDEQSLTKTLKDALRKEIETLVDIGEIEIKPTLIAQRTISVLDPDEISLPVILWGCNLEIRQLARQELRAFVEKREEQFEKQEDMFGHALSDRYPVDRNGEPTYIPREYMTFDEAMHNVARLRNEAEAKMKHADNLEAWARSTLDHNDASAG